MIRRTLALVCSLWFAGPAFAQSPPGAGGPMVPIAGPVGSTPFLATGNGATTATAPANRFGEAIDVKADFGAVPDAVSYTDGAITASSSTFTSSKASFTSADIGKTMVIRGAAAAGANLSTTVSTVNSANSVGLSLAASTTVSSAGYVYGTDNTPFVSAAVAAENSLWPKQRACLFFPSGNYLINGSVTQFSINLPGCVTGAGTGKTVIVVGPGLSGDLFSWSEAWQVPPLNTGIFPISSGWTGAKVADLTVSAISGNGVQNAFHFYDRNDFVILKDVEAYYFNGSCISIGDQKNLPVGYMRESRFYNLRIWGCGNNSTPSVQINSSSSIASQDATNELSFYNLDVESSNGPGVILVNSLTGSATGTERLIRFFGLRIEDSTGDNLVIGDPTLTGALSNIQIFGLEENAVLASTAGVRITAASASYVPSAITIQGLIGSATGSGIIVTAGNDVKLDMTTLGGGLTVGSSTLVTGPIFIDGHGQEYTWTTSIDSTSLSQVVMTGARYGNPTTATAYVSNPHDGTPARGNAIPAGSVDLQMARFANTQVASGANSTISGGENNTANNTDATVSGGLTNTASGYRSSISGGAGNTSFGQYSSVSGGQNNFISGNYSGAVGGLVSIDRQWYGARCHASGSLTDASGDANFCDIILRCQAAATNGSTCRLTSDNLAANSNDTINIPNNAAYALQADCVALSRATPANNEQWATITGLETRQSGVATTGWSGSLSIATAATRSNGTVTGSTLAISADTTNGGLNLTFATPIVNAALWDATCHIQAHQVQ